MFFVWEPATPAGTLLLIYEQTVYGGRTSENVQFDSVLISARRSRTFGRVVNTQCKLPD